MSSVNYPLQNGIILPQGQLSDITFRQLCSHDLQEVKDICRQLFPISYSEQWFIDITSSPRYFTRAPVHEGKIVGLVVAEVRHSSRLGSEDDGLVGMWPSSSTCVVYILSLGVLQPYRRHRLGSLLLEMVLKHATSVELSSKVHAVYLHALSSNTGALAFYRRHGFHLFRNLPSYYALESGVEDGLSLVIYVNGAQPPLTLNDVLSFVTPSCDPCSWLRFFKDMFRNYFLRWMPTHRPRPYHTL